MRSLFALFATLVFGACSMALVNASQSQAAGPGQVIASEEQKTSIDQALQFLLASAATDFHTHRPPYPARFRHVRFGHVVASDGAKQYMLCGEFLPEQDKGTPKWTPFATIKTSGYEQWLGASTYCQRSTIVWDDKRDMSSLLKSRLDSLATGTK
jgi:hypothetical protein